MAIYLLTEPAFIHGVYYNTGETVEFSNDLPPAMTWIPQDDDAKRLVDAQNAKRLSRGGMVGGIPNLSDLILKLKAEGYVVTNTNGDTVKIEGVDPASPKAAMGQILTENGKTVKK